MPGRCEDLRATDEVLQIHIAVAAKTAHGDLHERERLARLHIGAISLECAQCRARQVEVHIGDRSEPAALHEHRLLVEDFGGLQHPAVGGEHGRPGQAQLHQAQAHDAIIDLFEFRARELDEVDLDALGAQPIEEGLDQPIRIVIEVLRPVDEIEPNDTQRFLLQGVLDIEHAHMNDDLAAVGHRPRLKT